MTDDRQAMAILPALCALAAEAIEHPAVQPSDDLIALGADSLAFVAIAGRIRETWGVVLTFGDVMRNSRLQALAERVERELTQATPTLGESRAAVVMPFDD